MRTRLMIVFLVPLVGVLVVLGGAYAWSAARSIQQEFYAEQLGDLSYFVTSARQALRAGNPAVVDSEAARFEQLYDIRVVVVDRSGEPWAHGGEPPVVLEEAVSAQAALALSGRRSELPPAALPWLFTDAVLVEPVFDDGDVIGAVIISASVEAPRVAIIRHWVLLVVIAGLAALLGLFVVNRLAGWVLRPVQRVDLAMEAIEKGDMEARIADDTGPPELRRMILIFNSMAEEIERALSRQREFALNASHELRNPLNALLVRVELLATGLDEGWIDDIEATREEGRRMTRILDTLLSLARSGHGDAEPAVVDLAALAQRRVEAWQDVAAQRGISFVRSGETEVLSLTDDTMVESALDAVIDNAVKFSPAGTCVEVSASRQESGCVVAVRDHGPGVRDDELEHVTDRFWRSPGSQNQPGSGLGLAIATDLLHALDGELTVTSPEDGGLMVSLRLPEGYVR
ncbi:sensor histidine kinase [Microbacterium sp. NIBRBAC000506063]|uniref:sensor histidine kinase n=1 Tax=Microbacterium sp. NIBRBAC000506063 TaxID=2734618 RepID=UPI001BB61C4D|nr:HAMP domain-containing sensor histidine kinase [Microbacterium sp. NIBRBAC000506063]QTV79776.1 HAMP domain-containing histidine kinase [Microbacterium sp. NIBRBAC000506063]